MPVTFLSAVLLIVSLLAVHPVQAADTPPTENLSGLIRQALDSNPELRASSARWDMFKNRIRQAGSWEDPMLMLKIQNGIVTDPLNFGRDAMTQKVIGISQQIPFFGKRGLREEVAAREAEAQHYSHEERALELVRMVKESYYQLSSTDHQLALLLKNIEILDTFITLAQTKYSVGQGTQQDIFKAQVERSKLLDLQISLEQRRKSLAIGLNALLNRPATTQVGSIPDPAPAGSLPPAERLMAIAEENRPLLKGLQAQILKGTSSQALARKESYPDFNVSLEYMQRDIGDDMYALGVTFNLPVHRERRQAMVAEATSEILMSAEELNSTRNAIASGIADLLAQMEKSQKLAELYKDGIIPQADQSLESATIGYRVNKVDFLTLLDNRANLYNYEHMYYDALADYQVKKAQLSALVGKDLDEPQGAAPPAAAADPPPHSHEIQHGRH